MENISFLSLFVVAKKVIFLIHNRIIIKKTKGRCRMNEKKHLPGVVQTIPRPFCRC